MPVASPSICGFAAGPCAGARCAQSEGDREESDIGFRSVHGVTSEPKERLKGIKSVDAFPILNPHFEVRAESLAAPLAAKAATVTPP